MVMVTGYGYGYPIGYWPISSHSSVFGDLSVLESLFILKYLPPFNFEFLVRFGLQLDVCLKEERMFYFVSSTGERKSSVQVFSWSPCN